MKKKLLAMMTAIVLAFTMFVPVMAEEGTATETPESGTVLEVGEEESSEVNFTIVHTNDVHARIAGEAYVASYVKGLKDSGENVLLISAGDVLHGQTIATISQGKAIVDIMNAVGYDFMVPGNHDFNYGIARLTELEKSMNFKLLAANVVSAATKANVYTTCAVTEIDGLKVGLFGLATPETVTKTNPKNVAGYDFTAPVAAAIEMVDLLEEQGCDVIIAITHLGLDNETAVKERSTAIAEIPGVNIVIDGHSHTVLERGRVVKNAVIAQTGEYLNNIGVINVSVTEETIKVTPKLIETPEEDSDNWKADKTVLDVIARAEKANLAITSQVIGKTPVKLDGERADVRAKETNLSALLTAAMLKATGADISITNGGGIRASIEAGDITKGDILTVLPFGNFICTVDVKGSEFIKALEHGVSSQPEVAAHFSQVGGIKVKFDSSKAVGSRIVSVTMADGTELDPAKTYKVATNDFMAAGGDNYTMLGTKAGYMEFGALDEALIDYIASGVDISKVELGSMVDVKGEAPAPAPVAPAPEPTPVKAMVAEPTAATVYINGKSVAFQAYYIDGSNYFKLRDIAFALNDTGKQFEVTWDAEKSLIDMLAGKAYTSDGSELKSNGDNGVKAAVSTSAVVALDGTVIEVECYHIDGFNYFKLRDLGRNINFGVNWDAAASAISVVTAESYAE